jgi:hypothetical protein
MARDLRIASRRRAPHVLARLVTAGALVALGLLALTASGCNTTACQRHSDCDPGLVCSAESVCVDQPDAAIAGDAADADPTEGADAAVDAMAADAALADAAFDAVPTLDAVAADAAVDAAP